MLKEERYTESLAYLQEIAPILKQKDEESYNRLFLIFTSLTFLSLIANNNALEAYNTLSKLDSKLWKEQEISETNSISLYNAEKKITKCNILHLSSLLFFDNPWNSNYAYLLDKQQIELLIDQINSLLLKIAGVNPESIIETILQQNHIVEECKEQLVGSTGEKIFARN